MNIFRIRNAPPPAKNMPFMPGNIIKHAMDAATIAAITIQSTLKICFFVAISFCFLCSAKLRF